MVVIGTSCCRGFIGPVSFEPAVEDMEIPFSRRNAEERPRSLTRGSL